MTHWTWIDLTDEQVEKLATLQSAVAEHDDIGDPGSILAQVYVGDKNDARCVFLSGEQTEAVADLLDSMGINVSEERLVGEARE